MNIVTIVGLIAAIAAKTNGLPQARIVNGWNALYNVAPYIVSLQGKSAGHFCGGAILDEHWILTAAHCIIEEDLGNIVIKAGRYNLHKDETTGQERTIDYYKAHELYVAGPMPYDIALLYTKKPFVWTENVKPIALPEKDSIPKGNSHLFGWGLTSNAGNEVTRPEVLQTAKIPIVSLEECKKRTGLIHETNICTDSLRRGMTSCSSDSGGPLTQKNSQNKDMLVGVVSWGPALCGQPNTISVFGRVSAFIDWIRETKEDFYNRNIQ